MELCKLRAQCHRPGARRLLATCRPCDGAQSSALRRRTRRPMARIGRINSGASTNRMLVSFHDVDARPIRKVLTGIQDEHDGGVDGGDVWV